MDRYDIRDLSDYITRLRSHHEKLLVQAYVHARRGEDAKSRQFAKDAHAVQREIDAGREQINSFRRAR